ncbi:MAG TPA: hypothetical protein VLA79_01095 [Polyangia bacterium]|jgi:hypothetical protein|nr:hypothetical protein [Polyangia bacterium]
MRTNSSFAARTIGFAGVLWLIGALAVAPPAAAQASGMTPPPQYGPPAPPPPAGYPNPPPANEGWGAPPSAIAPNGEFVAPLSQVTQPTYLPQSVALSGPRMIRDWHDGDPIPWGYHREERVRKGEVISGSIVFGVPYLYSAFFAAVGADAYGSSGEGNKLGWLYLPVLGPLLELTEYSSSTFDYVMVLDAAAQGLGAVLMIHGLTTPRAVLVRNDLALSVVPAHLGKDGTGLMMLGRF